MAVIVHFLAKTNFSKLNECGFFALFYIIFYCNKLVL